LDVVVLCLSQLSRSNEADTHAPRLSDLRDSGRIEEESDAVDLP
jgi:replicative DNA helicase